MPLVQISRPMLHYLLTILRYQNIITDPITSNSEIQDDLQEHDSGTGHYVASSFQSFEIKYINDCIKTKKANT